MRGESNEGEEPPGILEMIFFQAWYCNEDCFFGDVEVELELELAPAAGGAVLGTNEDVDAGGVKEGLEEDESGGK